MPSSITPPSEVLVVERPTYEVELGVIADQHHTPDVAKCVVAPKECGASTRMPAEPPWSGEGEGQSSKEESFGHGVKTFAGQRKRQYAGRVDLAEMLADAQQ